MNFMPDREKHVPINIETSFAVLLVWRKSIRRNSGNFAMGNGREWSWDSIQDL